MTLKFSVDMEDILAFSRFHHERAGFTRSMLNRQRIFLGALIVLVLVLAALNVYAGQVPWILVLGAIFLAAFSTAAKRQAQCIDRNARQMYAEGGNRQLIGERELEILDSGVIERSFYGETLVYWRGIERIASSETHTFIYLSAVTALIVPHAKVTAGDAAAFRRMIENELTKAPPAAPPLMAGAIRG